MMDGDVLTLGEGAWRNLKSPSNISKELGNVNAANNFMLSAVGLGLTWAWLFLCSLYFSQTEGFSSVDSSFLALVWKIGVIAVLGFAVLFDPLKTTRKRTLIVGVFASVLGTLGSGLLIYATLIEPYGVTIMRITALTLVGLSYGLIIWLWAHSPQPEKLSLSVLKAGIACVVAGIVYLLFSQNSFVLLSGAIVLLPIGISCCQLYFRYGSLSQNNYEIIPCFMFRAPKYLASSFIILSLFLGIGLQFVALGPLPHIWTYSVLVAGAILCFCAYKVVGSEKAVNMTVFGFILFLALCAALALFTSAHGSYPSVGLFRIGSHIVISLCLTTSGFVAILLRKPIEQGIMIGFLSYITPLVIGETIWLVWPWEENGLLVIASILLVVSIGALLAGIVFSGSKQGTQEDPNNSSNKAAFSDSENWADFGIALETICNSIAEQNALTKREGEILVPLARGYTLKTIAEQNTVSYHTIKVQVKSVYQKLEIHSRDELLALIDQQKPSA